MLITINRKKIWKMGDDALINMVLSH